MGINLDKIKTQAELKEILKFLDEQGFGYHSDWDFHQKKVNHIINNVNTHNVKYDSDLTDKLKKLNDYDEIEKEAKIYFSKFSSVDRIMELLNEFYLAQDESVRTPYSRPDTKDILAWSAFKKKYNLKDSIGTGVYLSFYNLDKNYLKINFGNYKGWEFKVLYKLVFNEETKEFNDKKVGEWQDLGKIEIKFFQNGKANIKGDLKKLKEYYFKYLSSGNNHIINYNKKITITNINN
jgi:hypothetical protein